MRPLIPLLLMPLLLAPLAACDRQKAEQPQAEAPKEAAGKLDTSHKGEAAPAIPFLGPQGGPATLASFRGKPLLVNLWATWCAPCVAEMPMLDALAVREAGRLQVIVVSQDMEGKRAVDPFFAKAKFRSLEPYLDKQNVLMTALAAGTLPITILYDAKGKEVWRVVGAFDWEGEAAKTMIDAAIGG